MRHASLLDEHLRAAHNKYKNLEIRDKKTVHIPAATLALFALPISMPLAQHYIRHKKVTTSLQRGAPHATLVGALEWRVGCGAQYPISLSETTAEQHCSQLQESQNPRVNPKGRHRLCADATVSAFDNGSSIQQRVKLDPHKTGPGERSGMAHICNS